MGLRVVIKTDTIRFMACTLSIENVADTRPEPPFVGVDRYFDEPNAADGRATGLVGWAATARKDQRAALLRFCQWCACAPDGERRVVLLLMRQYEGRVPKGAVNDLAAEARVSRETVRMALKRFARYCPEAVSSRRRCVG